jgi:hypothetical protein
MPHSGEFYVKTANKKGCRVRMGKGDHVVVYSPDGREAMAVPLKKELATGTDHSIWKWFLKFGLVSVVALAILAMVLQ